MQLFNLAVLGKAVRFALVASATAGAIGASAQCVQTVTHSGANFSGGSFIAQAGFVDNEAAAASYTLPASAFPLKVNLIEMIFVTSNASVQTVTEWEVFVYDGTPQNGTLIASYESDDVILPHLRVGPGTAGVNLQFSVDPQDPEQIFVNNTSGTNTVTVGYRILRHNNPPAFPCLLPPSTATNAFPSTDADGNLSKPTENWLYAIDCGGLGAPAGWNRFSQLPTAFRPTGDWNIRFSYESTNPLTITDQPDDVNTTVGQPAIFQVAATGAGTLSYQWYKGTTQLTNSSRIFGTSTDTLIIVPTIATDAGDYRVVVSSACGSQTSNNARLRFGGAQATGNVILNNWSAPRTGQIVAMEVRNSSGTLLQSQNVSLDLNGNYAFDLNASVPPGTYDFYAKGSHWLKKLRGAVTVTSSGASGVNFTLTNGDVNNDNEVGPSDFTILSGTFGRSLGDAGYDARADLNGDDEVGPADFTILSAHFGEQGD